MFEFEEFVGQDIYITIFIEGDTTGQIPSTYWRLCLKYTRFEKARIIGARALQITMGAPILVKLPKGLIDPIKIATMEFDKNIIPITVLRE